MMIEKYSKPGDLVLDPMGGSGATLIAALMGRDCCIVELESHFVEPMKASWAKMQGVPMLGYTMGQAVILRGDARALPLCSADAVLTSPPYGDAESHTGGDTPTAHGLGRTSRGQRPVEARGQDSLLRASGYTRPAAIVTSPPYEEVASAVKNTNTNDGLRGHPETEANGMRYGRGENVGNLRGAAYWSSMERIYAECWRVLRPGGILALVLKGFTRDGKYVDLPGQTEALLLAAGWELHDHFRRELWSLSFWRTLQKRRDPAAFDDRLNYEEVLAFRKPEGAGDGVAAVLTSPPYEGSVAEEPSGIDWTKQADGRKKQEPHGVGAHPWGYTRPSAIITSPPYEGIVGDNKEGPSQTSVPGGWKAGTVSKHGGYTQPSVILTSPPYEGSLQGDKPSGKLFTTERRVNSPASGNRRSKRKPLGQGYTKEAPDAPSRP